MSALNDFISLFEGHFDNREQFEDMKAKEWIFLMPDT